MFLTKNWFTYCANPKLFMPDQKMIVNSAFVPIFGQAQINWTSTFLDLKKDKAKMSRLGRKIFCKITKPFSSNYCKMPDDRGCQGQIGLSYTDKICQGLVKPIAFYLIIRVSDSFIVDISRKSTIRIVFTIFGKSWWNPSITISASFPHVTKIHAILICAITVSIKTSILIFYCFILTWTTRPSVISIRYCNNDVNWEDDQGTKQNTKSSCSHFANLNL